MIAFGQDTNSSPRYSTWNGSGWSSVSSMSSVGAEPYWVVLRDCPTRNEKACGTLNQALDVHVQFYNGSTWSGATKVTGNADTNATRAFDLAYENQSGDLLLAYWQDEGSNDNKIGYRTYSGGSLSSESALSLPSTSSARFVSLYPDPKSDEVLMLVLNASSEIYAATWSGNSWSGVTTLESKASTSDYECFSAAYEGISGDALVVYHKSGPKQPRYRTWDGISWSSESQMPKIGKNAKWLRLAADPESNQVIFGSLDGEKDIKACVWNGSSWGNMKDMAQETSSTNYRQFDIAYVAAGGEAMFVYAEKEKSSARYRTWDGSNWSSEKSCPNTGGGHSFIQLKPGTAPAEFFIAHSDTLEDLELFRWDGSSMSSVQQFADKVSGLNTTEQFMVSAPSSASMQPADIPYFTDFESSVGAEWSSTTQSYDADFTNFLGRFNGTPVQLSLTTTVGETYQLRLDFYSIDSWNPNSSNTNVDYFEIEIDGNAVFHETFSRRPASYAPSYPNPADVEGELGFGTRSNTDKDGIYRNVTVEFTATTSVTTIEFSDGLNEGGSDLADESWGIDNVNVATSRFRDVSVAKGFSIQSTTDAEYASGIYWADFDNDGDLDAVLGGNSSSRYMKNNSQGSSFTASTFGAGNERRGAALFDCDNDGDVDFWSGNHNSYYVETCYLNNGSASFSDAGNFGFSDPNNNEGVAAADVNRDGWCDIVHFSENGNWIGEHHGDPGGSLPSLVGSKASSEGLNDSGDVGNGDYASSGDFNNDGYLDFFYHYGTGKLFASNGDGTYTENARGISVYTSGSEKMGSAWGDYDNDGDLDLFVARHASNNTGNLWRNDVNWSPTVSGSFTNQTISAYVIDESGQRGCAWGDYDNDGDLDLYVVTRSGPNRLYQNQNDGTFRLVHEGADIDGNGHDAVFVDYDNDGDLDIAYTREDTTNVLLENRTNDSNYLKVRLVGVGGGGTNVAAVGVRVELWNAAETVRLGRRDIGVARGFGGTEPLWAHFGVSDPSATYTLKVWFHSRDNSDPLEVAVVPNAVSTTIGSVTIPQMFTVTEGNVRKRIIFWREVPNRP